MALSEAIRLAAKPALISAGDPAWHQFVLAQPGALPYHHPSWVATLADTYGYDPFAVAIHSSSGEIVGGIPIVQVGGRWSPRRWVALPFSDVCPPLTVDGVSSHAVGAAVAELQREQEVPVVEIRAAVDGFERNGEVRGVHHALTLTDPEALFAAFKPQVRRNIRKAQSAGVDVRIADRQTDLTRVYFDLHVETRRRLGVPSQPKRFFEKLWQNVIERGLGFVLLAYCDGVAVAGAVFLEWNGRVVYKYGASDRQHWPLRPNNLLFWECIQRSCEAGAHTLDFGRTDVEDTGLRSFKENWGALEETLLYTTFGRRARTGSGAAGRLLRPMVRVAPTWVGRSLGAVLYRHAA